METMIIANEKGRELLESQDKSVPDGKLLQDGRLTPKMKWAAGSILATAVGLIAALAAVPPIRARMNACKQ